jgi:hypothetical protein
VREITGARAAATGDSDAVTRRRDDPGGQAV